MKKILSYKLFENDEFDDEAPEGFRYSESEVIDFLGDLMDNLDFEIKESSNISLIKKLYLNEEFDEVRDQQALTKSTWVGWEVVLVRPTSEKTNFTYREIGYYPRTTIYLNSSLFELEVYKELQTILPRFERFFQNLRCSRDEYELRLLLLDKVVEDEKLARIQKIKEDNVRSLIHRRFSSIYDEIKNTRTLSPIFKKAIFLNKLGESGYGFRGTYEGGNLILPINTTKLSKVVIKNNLPKVEDFLSDFSFKYITKKEFRIITENDLKELLDAYKKVHSDSDYYLTLKQLKERYEGLYGFIIKFDYNRWSNDLMKEE